MGREGDCSAGDRTAYCLLLFSPCSPRTSSPPACVAHNRSVHPTSLTVRAYCADLNVEYPVGPTPTGSNANYSAAGILPGNATQVVWNPYQWKDLPGIPQFAQATYTLRMYDERGPSAPANKGGYLSPYMDKTKFAIYMPRDYVDFSGECSECRRFLMRMVTLHLMLRLHSWSASANTLQRGPAPPAARPWTRLPPSRSSCRSSL